VEAALSVVAWEMDCFGAVAFSLLRARTVEPCEDPGNGFRRVVVLDRTIPPPAAGLGSAGGVPLGLLSGEETGETRVVVVKKDRTLSATRLILALARL
jgi:hypothetical protein